MDIVNVLYKTLCSSLYFSKFTPNFKVHHFKIETFKIGLFFLIHPVHVYIIIHMLSYGVLLKLKVKVLILQKMPLYYH